MRSSCREATRERLSPTLFPGSRPEDDLTVATPDRRIVFVVGPGRSGTSTMAGALSYSGYQVPQAIKGNETNPSGFFEPRWVVNFHRTLLRKTGVRTLDTDPTILERMDAVAADEKVRDELRTWLSGRLDKHDHLVIKDPRMVWFTSLWVSVAQELGQDPGFVVMLRHPSEVSSSRSEYYNAREVTGVAGWINVALMTETLTAGSPRSLVHYPNLTADWRTELIRTRDLLGLRLDPAPEEKPHPVDDFIDPKLRRMKPGWENIEVPAFLQDLGDRTFDALGSIADHGDSAETSATLDQIRSEYATVHEDALALVNASVKRMREEVSRKAARRARAKAREKFAAQAVATSTPAQGLGAKVARKLGRGGSS